MRMELEVSAPAANMGEWDAAAELAEVEKLAEMGVIIRPENGSGRKNKGKGKAVEGGHVVFADGREECEF